MEFLNTPTKIMTAIVGVFLVIQIIGELLEFKGKVVPECIKIRKYFDRKKREREIINQVPNMLKEFQKTLDEFKSCYNSDNINKRNTWMKQVDETLERHENWKIDHEDFTKEMCMKLDKNNADTLSLLIDSKRNAIIDFAAKVIDEKSPVLREQFKRVFKLYEEYEEIIEKNHMTNGEVDIAYRIITESYEKHMRNHTFVEDIRGYDI